MDDGFAVTWRRLLTWAAWSAVVEYVIVLAVSRQVIPPVIVIGLVIVVGAVLLRRPGKAGSITLLVALALFVATNLLFAIADLGEWRSFPSFAVSAAALVSGFAGITAAVAVVRGKDGPSVRARTILLGGAAGVVGLLAVNALGSLTYDDPSRAASDVVLVAKDIKYTPATLTATAGRVTFYVDNRDGVLHDFHLGGVGKFNVAASHAARRTYTLTAGTYHFVCDYHDDMKGTLTVS